MHINDHTIERLFFFKKMPVKHFEWLQRGFISAALLLSLTPKHLRQYMSALLLILTTAVLHDPNPCANTVIF